MKFGLSDFVLNAFQLVFENYPELSEVIIYGSRAKGNYREGSDIDLTLKGEFLNNSILNKITSDLDEINHPYLIDLSIYENLKSESLKEHINRVGQIFYKREIAY